MSDCSSHAFDVIKREDNLKACPFCGGSPHHYSPGPIDHIIECSNPQCYTRTHGWVTYKEAAEAWNKRYITGDTSDGYHTFNELYHHRAILFSVVVSLFSEVAWKAKKHHDGTMYDDMFIVGIDTPEGQATYHYDIDPYWDIFKCKELEYAPEWDGHTPDQAIDRIAGLANAKVVAVMMNENR